MEAAVAIVIVSLTAFKGLFGDQNSRISKRSRQRAQYTPSSGQQNKPSIASRERVRSFDRMILDDDSLAGSAVRNGSASRHWFRFKAGGNSTENFDEEQQTLHITRVTELEMESELGELAEPESTHLPLRARDRSVSRTRSDSAMGYTATISASR